MEVLLHSSDERVIERLAWGLEKGFDVDTCLKELHQRKASRNHVDLIARHIPNPLAMECLVECGPPALDHLFGALEANGYPLTVLKTIFRIPGGKARLANPKCFEEVQRCSQSDSIVEKLGYLGPPAVDYLLSELNQTAVTVEETKIMESLARIDDPRGLAPLLKRMTGHNVRAAAYATRSLRFARSQVAMEAVQKATKHAEWLVRDEAEAALAMMQQASSSTATAPRD